MGWAYWVVAGLSAWVLAGGDDVSESVAGGQINWTQKHITATGRGAPEPEAANVAVARLGAERAAKNDAFQNILKIVRRVRVSGTQTAGGRLVASTELSGAVEKVVRAFRVLDTKYYTDGGVDLVVQLSLDAVAVALMPEAGSAASRAPEAAEFTGVVINAKGLAVAPALAPQILDERNKPVYTAMMVARDSLRQGGMVAYTKSLTAATRDPRIGARPLVIRAARAAQPGSADMVLATEDAAKLGPLQSVLARGKVIVVTD